MTQEQAIEKIKKLLRLGRSPNRNEAMAAIAKAHEIAAAQGVAIDGVDPDAEHARITHESGVITRRSHARKLCHGVLKRHFGVIVIGSSDGAIYVGPDVNIQIARHVEEFLVRQVGSEWKEWAALKRGGWHRRQRKPSPERRRSFENAFFGAVDLELELRPIRNDADQIRLEVEKYVNRNFCVRHTKMNVKTSKRHLDDWYAGHEAGRNVKLSRPVDVTVRARMIGE
ncbi:MAG: DUF2786 domain-containing protein [Kiritimatiellae bacterium]|nr:DUF2786 domain-containing protein [Kiritimatiellia bacterium]